MPSTSAAQHRWIEWIRHDPAARAKTGMSQTKVDEWSHADRGSPWRKADGGVAHALHLARMAAGGALSPPRALGWHEAVKRHVTGPEPPDLAEQAKTDDFADRIMDAQQKDPYAATDDSGKDVFYTPPSQIKAHGGAIGKALRIARTHFQAGGYEPPPVSNIRGNEMQDIRGEIINPGGVTLSEVPGRTDHLPQSVAAGAYVLPADVVSGLGESNTLAGAKVIDQMLYSQPYGIKAPQHHGHSTIPHPPAEFREGDHRYTYAAAGGVHGQHGKLAPVVLAGGEYVINPHQVAYHPLLGGGDPNHPDPKHHKAALKKGHDVLDAFVKHHRAQHIKTLKKLPGPAK